MTNHSPYEQQQAPASTAAAQPALTTRTIEERKMILARAIQTQIGPEMRIESQSEFQAVLVFGRKPNHLLHFLIGVFTLGLWWIVWIILAIASDEKRRMLTVDEYRPCRLARLSVTIIDTWLAEEI